MIPKRRREVRGLLRTGDGQTTWWRDAESLRNDIAIGGKDTDKGDKADEKKKGG